jgi:hypothetical protein
MLRKLLIRNCVGGIWCASARAARVNFQACSFNHSDISPSLKSTTCERSDRDYRTRRHFPVPFRQGFFLSAAYTARLPALLKTVSDLLMSRDHLRRFSWLVSEFARTNAPGNRSGTRPLSPLMMVTNVLPFGVVSSRVSRPSRIESVCGMVPAPRCRGCGQSDDGAAPVGAGDFSNVKSVGAGVFEYASISGPGIACTSAKTGMLWSSCSVAGQRNGRIATSRRLTIAG